MSRLPFIVLAIYGLFVIQSLQAADHPVVCKRVQFSCFIDDGRECIDFCSGYSASKARLVCSNFNGTFSRISTCSQRNNGGLIQSGGACRFNRDEGINVRWIYYGNPFEIGKWCDKNKGIWMGFGRGVNTDATATCSIHNSKCREKCSKFGSGTYKNWICHKRCQCSLAKCSCPAGLTGFCALINNYCSHKGIRIDK